MDTILGKYTVKRSTRKRPLAFFNNTLDVTCLVAYIAYYENTKSLTKKKVYKRRLFYRPPGRELCGTFV